MYQVCLLMAIFIEISMDQRIPTSFTIPRLNRQVPTDYMRDLLNSCFIMLLVHVLRHNNIKFYKSFYTILEITRQSLTVVVSRKKCVSWLKVIAMDTLWIRSLNLIMIVICNPIIVNPGPAHSKVSGKNKLSVFYQNVRGFIPPTELGKPNPQLSSIKLAEFQTYVYESKPDIIVLNETWLTKRIKDSEIFPNENYKVFRLDRTRKTHPEDPSNPDKYKKSGGGVLIAVKSDLDCESTDIKIKCKAEIMSVSIGLRDGTYICFSTLYRVTDLGAENHRAVDNYLRKVASRKNAAKLFLLVT